jgi:excinuclease UvrABC nuclease subunit
VGEKTARKLLKHFGSVRALKALSFDELSQVVKPSQARRILEHLAGP